MEPQLLVLLRTLLSGLIREELQPAVEAALTKALPEAIRRAQAPSYLTRQETAEYLGRSVRSVDYLRSSGSLAYVKRGGRVLFAVSDLEGYLAEGFVPVKSVGKADGIR